MSLTVDRDTLLTCCHSGAWADGVLRRAPFASLDELISAARTVWWTETPVAGWLEAFSAHPRLGDKKGVEGREGKFGELSRGEQSAAAGAGQDVLEALRDWNAKYEAKFGHIFIACAAGTPAERMLQLV
ncbi:hypothetical protein QBZ16_005207 [Prototheca wickerhamii]|uniref:2-oxo-4-hydroxy-4-carboxy-5-ureidoimidazoline decarboxylase n=1 Tax=Prototheca wickerhamii TaxID=3111 RepID=A0AAD9MGI1_PROWI|nr:hypothetical protein QBZ16_005207 [Prototheca wickerhamii]